MDIETILNRHKALKAVKTGYWSDLWRDVRKYVYPNYDFDRSEGGQRGTDIYDTTAEQARQRLASGIYQWMAPPDKRWFELTADDDELAKKESVRTYFSAVTAKIMQGLANSNWSAREQALPGHFPNMAPRPMCESFQTGNNNGATNGY